MTWHKIGGYRNTELEFLDMPGLIPYDFGKRYTEAQATMLCMCRIFGDKVINREKTAYDLVHLLSKLQKENPTMVERTVWRETQRIYGVDFQAAVRREGPFLPNFVPVDNPEPFCGKLLSDFNNGYWGKVQLEVPPDEKSDRQDWSRMLGRRQGQEELQELPSPSERPALGAPADVVQMPGRDKDGKRVPEREKVPVGRTERERQDLGLFDGW